MDAMKAWAKSRGFFVASGDFTHLLLNGGKLNVPPCSEDEFLDEYARMMREDCNLFVCERRADVFAFFVDVDYVSAMPPSDEDLAGIADVVVDAVLHRALEDPAAGKGAIVATASKPKALDGKNAGLHKRGVHVIFPALACDTSGARSIRLHILQALRERLGDEDWDKMVDDGVYGGSGLRMIGSKKMERCTSCSKKGDAGCAACGGRGSVPGESVYLPVGADGLSLGDVLRAASIRLREPRPPLAAIKPPDASEGASESGAAPRAAPGEAPEGAAAIIQEELASLFPECFGSGQRITRVTFRGDYALACTDSKFCTNLGREHRSNNIYFYLSSGAIYQKCFCRCPDTEGRRRGMCKDYKGAAPRPPSRAIKDLFGHESDNEGGPDESKTKERPGKKAKIEIVPVAGIPVEQVKHMHRGLYLLLAG